jgi:hypothetical protein
VIAVVLSEPTVSSWASVSLVVSMRAVRVARTRGKTKKYTKETVDYTRVWRDDHMIHALGCLHASTVHRSTN